MIFAEEIISTKLVQNSNYVAACRLIDESKHHILKAAHPSGLSANRGFFGCRFFTFG